MAKIIRLTESDLNRIVKRVIEEQMNMQQDINLQMKKIKPEMGGKYCFGNPQKMKSAYGYNVKLHKVKSGDTLSGIASKHPGVTNVEDLIRINNSCSLDKGLKSGDVIAIVIMPEM
jgi:predicted Zn-dependent protease